MKTPPLRQSLRRKIEYNKRRAELFLRLTEHLDIPGVVCVNEVAAALFVSELRVNQKARPYRMRKSQRFGKANAEILRDLLTGNRSNVDIAV